MKKVRIKPLFDFADKNERLFIRGKYYDVAPEKAEEYLLKGIILVRKIWYKDGIKHTQYGGLENEENI